MEPEISPLAKRLAEENNVDWRGLNGSGADGRILERDVLEYLARVMSGEEDLNPTAEPVPQGMEAWPEEDVQGYFDSSDEASTKPVAEMPVEAGSDDDALFDAPAAESAASEDIKDDMFLFGEDEPTESAPLLDMNVDANALVNGSADLTSNSELSTGLNAVDANLGTGLSDFGTLEESAPVSAEANTLSGNVSNEDVDDLEFDEDVASLFVDDVEEAPAPSFGTSQKDDLLDHVMPPSPPPMDLPSTPVVGAAAAAGAAAVHEAVAKEEVASEPAFAEAVPVAEPAMPKAAPSEAKTPEPVAEVLSEPAPDKAADAPFVSYGTLLRRHTDVSHLMQAQTDIAKELSQDESAVLSALVLRAVAKASQSSPLGGSGQFGVADVSGGGIALSGVDNILSQGFASLITDVQNAPASSADALALVVVDMSSSGVDEAVLNIDVPVLTVGRTLLDSTEGTYRSTLSLSGDISVEAGSKFLASVVDLLDAPIRLML